MAISSTGRELGLLSQQVLASVDNPPANAVYVDPSDTMQINIASSVVPQNLTFNCRVLSNDGSILVTQQIFSCTGSRIITRQLLPPGQGLLLSVSVSVPQNSGVRRGMVYVSINLIRGNTTLTTVVTQPLCSGYATDQEVVTYPPGLFEASYSGSGNIRSITGSAPSIGADIAETVPFGAIWRLKSFRYNIATSATVISRTSALVIDDGTNILLMAWPFASIAASLTAAFNWAEGLPGGSLNQTQQSAGFPAQMILLPGWRIRTQTFSLQVGDQVSAPQYAVEEWLQI